MISALFIGLHLGHEAFPEFSPHGIFIHLQAQLRLVLALPIAAISLSWNSAALWVSVEIFCDIFISPLAMRLSVRASKWQAWILPAAIVFCRFIAMALFVCFNNAVVDRIGYPPPAGAWACRVAWVRAMSMFAAGKQAIVMLAPFLVIALMDSGSRSARVLGSRILHFLGEISYSICLWHLPICAVPLSASCAVATFLYFCHEAPARRIIRHLLTARPHPGRSGRAAPRPD